MSYREREESPFIVSGGQFVCAVDVETGAVRWTNQDFGDAAGGALLVTAERIYVAGWKQAGAIDARSGATLPRGNCMTIALGDQVRSDDRAH